MKIVAVDSRRIAARPFKEELAIVDLRGRTVHRLNATAARLWSVVARGGSYDELVGDLCDNFDVDAAIAQRDVDAFLASLEGAGLVTVDRAPEPPQSQIRVRQTAEEGENP